LVTAIAPDTAQDISVREAVVTIPSSAVQKISEEAEPFREALEADETNAIEFKLGSSESQLTPALRVLLRALLDVLARGSEVVLMAVDAEVSTQMAAQILGVSRPHVVSLIESGVLPARKVGTHRRLRVADVLAYQEVTKRFNARKMDSLVATSAQYGGYDISWPDAGRGARTRVRAKSRSGMQPQQPKRSQRKTTRAAATAR
jgi:excisionase family DNA binding protein